MQTIQLNIILACRHTTRECFKVCKHSRIAEISIPFYYINILLLSKKDTKVYLKTFAF